MAPEHGRPRAGDDVGVRAEEGGVRPPGEGARVDREGGRADGLRAALVEEAQQQDVPRLRGVLQQRPDDALPRLREEAVVEAGVVLQDEGGPDLRRGALREPLPAALVAAVAAHGPQALDLRGGADAARLGEQEAGVGAQGGALLRGGGHAGHAPRGGRGRGGEGARDLRLDAAPPQHRAVEVDVQEGEARGPGERGAHAQPQGVVFLLLTAARAPAGRGSSMGVIVFTLPRGTARCQRAVISRW